MKYKLLNWLFGWDYILWSNSASQGVRRIKILPDGTLCYWRYKNIKVMDKIETEDQVTWLTCLPEKYLNKTNKL